MNYPALVSFGRKKSPEFSGLDLIEISIVLVYYRLSFTLAALPIRSLR